MTQRYVKFISINQVLPAPKNLQLSTGEIIFNFNTDPDLMLIYGYKPYVEEAYPEQDAFKNITPQYREEENQVVKYYLITDKPVDTIQTYLQDLAEAKFAEAQQTLIPVIYTANNASTSYFVKLEWYNTYCNAYQSLKFAESQTLITSVKVIVITAEGKVENLTVTSSEEFSPLYLPVVTKYNEEICYRNEMLVRIQDTTDLEELKEIEEELLAK